MHSSLRLLAQLSVLHILILYSKYYMIVIMLQWKAVPTTLRGSIQVVLTIPIVHAICTCNMRIFDDTYNLNQLCCSRYFSQSPSQISSPSPFENQKTQKKNIAIFTVKIYRAILLERVSTLSTICTGDDLSELAVTNLLFTSLYLAFRSKYHFFMLRSIVQLSAFVCLTAAEQILNILLLFPMVFSLLLDAYRL